MNLWCNYKKVLHDTLDLQFAHPWADWESKGTVLSAKVFKHDYIIKSRVVEIWNEKSSIYNNIIYPKTGSNLPCFGMDLMGFFDKKVIIVFDFQHPVENYLFSVEGLPKSKETIDSLNPEIIFLKTFILQSVRCLRSMNI